MAVDTDLEELARLQKEVERLNAKAQRAEGARAEVLSRLQREFGCGDLKAAKRKLKELQEEEAAAQTHFRNALAKYRDEFGTT